MAQIFDLTNKSNKSINKNNNKNNAFKYNFESIMSSEKIEIDSNEYILKEEKKCKGNYYLDISYIKNGEIYLIGRYDTFENNISVENSKEYILIYCWSFNRNKEKATINKILSLYNKEDCTEIVGTFEELGKLFNDSVIRKQQFDESNTYKLIYRSDIERKRRF